MADELSGFLVTEKDGTTHLPTRRNGKVDHGLMGAAKAALTSPGGHRGNKYEGPHKVEAIAKLKALYKSEGLDWEASDSPRFVIALADLPFTGKLVRIPIALTGRWHKRSGQEIDLTEKMLDELVENFTKESNGVNVDYDHASESPLQGLLGPSPSAGKIVKIDEPEAFGDTRQKIVWGWYEPTDKARELIASKEYRQISPAISPCPDRKTGEDQGWTLTSVALTNRPVIQEMPEIHLAEGELIVPDANPATSTSLRLSAEGGKDMGLAKLKLMNSADGTHEVHGPDGAIGTVEDKHLRQYAKEHLDMCDGAKASEAADAARVALLSEIGAAGIAPAELKTMLLGAKEDRAKVVASERAANGRKELSAIFLANTVSIEAADALEDAGTCTREEVRAAEHARKRVDAALAAGKILPVDRRVAFSIALGDGAAFDEWIKARPASDRMKSVGIGGVVEFSNVQDEIKTRATALMHERKLDSMAKATEVLLSEDRELYNRYRNSQPQAAAPAK